MPRLRCQEEHGAAGRTQDTGAGSPAFRGCGDPPTTGDTSEGQHSKAAGLTLTVRFGEMLTSRLKGARAGSGSKPHPRASGGTAGCCARLLPAQPTVRLLCACCSRSLGLFLSLLRTQRRGGVYTKIWVFPVQSFYNKCKLSLSASSVPDK